METIPFRISLNLIPRKHLESQKKLFALRLINRLSIVLLVIMIFLTGTTLSIRSIQKGELDKATQSVKEVEAQVKGLQSNEAQVNFLKKTLSQITNLQTGDLSKRAIFSLIVSLSPKDINFTDISISKDGTTVLTGSSSSVDSIDQFLVNLGNKDKNAGLISTIDLEGLNLGKDGQYKFTLKILPKVK